MQSFRIFRHSIRQVFLNLKPAIIVSLPVMVVAVLALGLIPPMQTPEGPIPNPLSGLLMLAASLCVAVNWHRFVLLEEAPAVVPHLHWRRMLAYLGRTLQIGLCMLPLIVLAMAIVYLGATSPVVSLLFFPLALIGTVISLRFSVMLPAAAVGRGFGPMEAFLRTQGSSGTIFLLIVLMTVAQMLLVFALAPLVALGLPLLVLAGEFVLNWIVVMVTASVLTTLYGHYIEGRELL